MSVTRVPLCDLRRHADDAELESAFRRVLASGKYILGEEVEAFERECESALGVRHAIGVSSGTDAILATLMALGVGAGDEVVCPSYTFIATASAAARLGATPVFADVMPCCANIDARDAERRITRKTRAIISVRLFGQCSHEDDIARVAREHGVALVVDAAQSIGAAPVTARAACYSFFPSKNIGALGDAGLVATDDDDLAKTMRALRVHGATGKHHHALVGGNFRIDALQAAFLRVKLRGLAEITTARRANAARYDALLAEIAHVRPPARCGDAHVFNQYVITSDSRDALRTHLGDANIETQIYYPTPLHRQPCFAHLAHAPLPVSERAAHTTLALPMFPELREDEARYVAARIASFQVASSAMRSK